MAVVSGERPQTARLVFDYQDVNNYKAVGLRTDAGQQKWVLKVVQDGVESDPSTGSELALRHEGAGLVAPLSDTSLQPGVWYQLDLVVGPNKVTLYAECAASR